MINIKKIGLICLIFILTGCSVKYDLTINEDYSINEKITATENTNKMESLTKLKGDNAVNYLYDIFKRDNKDAKINTTTQDDETKSTATMIHNDILDYANNFESDIFEKVNIQKNNNEVLLTAKQISPLTNDSNYSFIYDDITISIYVPFKVIENNADEIKGNNYIWYIRKNNNVKDIKLKYDESRKKDNINIKINDKTYNFDYAIVTISGIIVVISIIALVVVIKNKKNNSF